MSSSNHPTAADNANVEYCFSYEFDGSKWAGSIFASTWEEAEMKLRAMADGTIDGVFKGLIPADDRCPTCGQDWEGNP